MAESYIESLAGKHHEAIKLLPPFEDTRFFPKTLDEWSVILFNAMMAHSEYQTDDQIGHLNTIASSLNIRGVYRQAFDAHARLARLNILMGKRKLVVDNIESMTRIQTHLVKDLGATDIINQLKA